MREISPRIVCPATCGMASQKVKRKRNSLHNYQLFGGGKGARGYPVNIDAAGQIGSV
jgi:hypothetical protein